LFLETRDEERVKTIEISGNHPAQLQKISIGSNLSVLLRLLKILPPPARKRYAVSWHVPVPSVGHRASPSAEAVNYTLGPWAELTVLAGDGAVPIDNNVSEREMS
jgi:hypothetical protein